MWKYIIIAHNVNQKSYTASVLPLTFVCQTTIGANYCPQSGSLSKQVPLKWLNSLTVKLCLGDSPTYIAIHDVPIYVHMYFSNTCALYLNACSSRLLTITRSYIATYTYMVCKPFHSKHMLLLQNDPH